MMNRLKKLFTSAQSQQPLAQDELKLAAAALLVEAAVMDGTFDDAERTVVTRLLTERFALDAEEVQELLSQAEATIANANELYTLTRTVKDNFEHPERIGLIEMLWEVVYADGKLDDYESNLVRRLAGLLYVSDRESGEARKRILDKIALKE
ncbi:tellurite resistance TerB family protein [Magnetovibrio blakemorei]|uniref:Co-chaperone DjlA N-terminal domain-containing protein n=1 Tax=Magnetovibrio blakemorei TaxID=28181 RepID=A0A1E5QCC5_9PROT|nr:TerB family tellurite resistance protein [Magnetovibrio blakemorei]OEJ69695.1 hypothetical protein BEN30_02355 [Magnetovibrio blakemorei]